MRVIGYARVSTNHQKFDSQVDALMEFGVDKIYTEKESGCKQDRPVLEQVLKELQEGDTLVIFKLDRLARGTKHLLELMSYFEERNIKFVSIQNQIDTSTPIGKLLFTIMGAFAEMEASLIRERVVAGLDSARNKGVVLGRPQLSKEVGQAIDLYENSQLEVDDILIECNISKSTLYRHIKLRETPLRT